MIKKSVINNSMWIIVCKVIQSILGLIINIFTARYLGPYTFGVINYAASLAAFVLPIVQLGLTNTLVQELIEDPEQEGKIMGTTLFISFLTSVVAIIGIATFVFFTSANDYETIIVCILYSAILLFQSLELIEYWFQSKLISKYVSVISLAAYFIVSGYKILLLIFNKNVYWFAISNALDYCIIAIFSIIVYRKKGGAPLKISIPLIKKMLSKSKYYIIANLMVTIFTQTDKIMLKFMMGAEQVGYYSTAVSIAGLTSFVFKAIIDSFRPVIVENVKEDSEEYKANMIKLYSIVLYFAIFQSVVIMLLSKYLVYYMYGNEYMESVSVLKIIVWYTTFAYIGSARNVWVLAKNKHKYVPLVDLFGALFNIGLNALFIPYLGVEGAAIASLLTQFITNIVIVFTFKELREANILLLKSFNPKIFIEVFCDVLKVFREKFSKKLTSGDKNDRI